MIQCPVCSGDQNFELLNGIYEHILEYKHECGTYIVVMSEQTWIENISGG